MPAKNPAPYKPPGQRRFAQAVTRRPAMLYHENYNLLPTTEDPSREHLFSPTPAGVPAKAKQVKPAPLPHHWSNRY